MIKKYDFYSLPLNIINGKEMKEVSLYYDFIEEINNFNYNESNKIRCITYPYINKNTLIQINRIIIKCNILKIILQSKKQNKKRSKKISSNYINNLFTRFNCSIFELKIDFNNVININKNNIEFNYLPSSLKILFVHNFFQNHKNNKTFLLPNSLKKVSIQNILIYLPLKTNFVECKNINYILNTKKINLKVLIENQTQDSNYNIKNIKYKKQIRTQFHYFFSNNNNNNNNIKPISSISFISSPIISNTTFIELTSSYIRKFNNNIQINDLNSKNLFIKNNNNLNSLTIKNYYNNILLINCYSIWYSNYNIKNIELLNKCKILQVFGNFNDFNINTIIRDCILFIISKKNKSYIESEIKTRDIDYFCSSETSTFNNLQIFKSLITS